MTRMKRGGPSGGRGDHRLWPALIPGLTGTVGGRVAARIDTDAALDETPYARPLMAVQVGTAAGEKRDAVTAQEQRTFRQRVQRRGKLLARHKAGASRCAVGTVRRIFPSPDGSPFAAGFEVRGTLAADRFVVMQYAVRLGDRAVHHENKAWTRGQGQFGIVHEYIFVEPERGRHRLLLVGRVCATRRASAQFCIAATGFTPARAAC